MIKIRMNGGLGNQLFQYAMIRKIAEETGEEVVMWSSPDYDYKKFFQDIFVGNPKVITTQMGELSMRQKIGRRIYNKMRCKSDYMQTYTFEKKYKNLYATVFDMFYCENGYLEVPKLSKTAHLDGYFQSERYFEGMRDILRKELQLQKPLNMDDAYLSKLKNTKNSICLHIRLGDYLNHPLHAVCTKEYYIEAMKKLSDELEEPVFYVFSNDVELAKEMCQEYECVFEPEGYMDYEVLHIMALCDHFILSNSSFSWWAQFLSMNDTKKVIVPDRWFNGEVPTDIWDDDFIKIKTTT